MSALNSETFYGTKELVEEYVEEVARCISLVRQAPPSLISLEEKQDFFRSSAKNLGASALCLSGGASFGYYHFGVVRALLDTGLLPRVITGTSAGAIGASAAILWRQAAHELTLDTRFSQWPPSPAHAPTRNCVRCSFPSWPTAFRRAPNPSVSVQSTYFRSRGAQS